ncbi:MAG: DUF3438 family protein [Pseudomonadota bacterium]
MRRALYHLFVAVMIALSPAVAASQVPEGGFIQKLEFRDTTVSEALRLISELTGANVIATSEASTEQLTMIVRNTTVRGAISTIARVTGLSFTFDRETNSYLLLTPSEFSSEVVIFRDGNIRIFTLRNQNVVTAALTIENLFGDRVELDLDTEDPDALVTDGTAIQGSRSTSTSSSSDRFRSNSDNDNNSSGGNSSDVSSIDRGNLNARELAQLLELGSTGGVGFGDAAEVLGLEPTIFVTVNRDHNLLFVRTSDQAVLQSIEQVIRATDRPTKQVLLEMKILALSLNDEFRSIFNFGIADDDGTSTILTGNFPLEGGTFFLQLLNDNLLAQIELLESENRVQTLSTPLLVAANNSPAELFVGEEAVLTRGFDTQTIVNDNSTNSFIEAQTEIREVGQTLQIIPRINADGTITMVVRQENSTIAENSTDLSVVDDDGNVTVIPIDTVNTARVEGTVTAMDGATIAFGGLLTNSQVTDRDQVPILGDIPILGTAFRGDVETSGRTELVILITPHVYSTGQAGEVISRRRLASLSQNDAIDSDGFDASRNQTPPTNRPGQQQSYVSLTRYAASLSNGTLPPPGGVFSGIVETPLAPSAPLVFGRSGGVIAEAVGTWRQENLYVTSVLLENVSDTVVTLSPRDLRAPWLAATLESDFLSPRGQEGSRNYIYLISNQPYDEVLARTAIGGAL